MIEYRGVAAMAIAVTATLFAGVQAHAAVLMADGSNLRTVFAAAQGGDVIKVTGAIGPMTLQNKVFSSTVTLDAQNASFTDSITFTNVTNLNILGGTFGSAINPMRTSAALSIYGGGNMTLSKLKFIGNGTGVGLRTGGVVKLTVSAGLFTNLRAGMGITSSADIRLSSNRFVGMTSDGINLADTRRVTATTNWCYASNMSFGAHPDCIQMWSIAGSPIISDIVITKTNVSGNTQGITLFDGGGTRISITDNIIATSFPQGIACVDCTYSTITGNTVTTIPGSRWRTSINIIGGGNNYVANNTVAPLNAPKVAALSAFSRAGDASLVDDNAGIGQATLFKASPGELIPDFMLEDYLTTKQGLADGWSTSSDGSPLSFDPQSSLAAVPEPAMWAQLILGFALIGGVRRRASRIAVVHAVA